MPGPMEIASLRMAARSMATKRGIRCPANSDPVSGQRKDSIIG
jgi:hypothetical protein